MSYTKIFFILLSGFGLVVALIAYQFLKSPYLDREIADSVTASSEWVEITPKEPLQSQRQIQQIILYLEKPIKKDENSWKIVLADGSAVMPEVQLVDQHGNRFDLTDPVFIYPAALPSYMLRGFGIQDLPRDRVYPKVRIRSDKPFQISKVVWRCYNQWDRK
jgi:hypothetical protein